ncbi:hypothetical protein SRHO_G00143390 [Serrasalmus rhombeus]
MLSSLLERNSKQKDTQTQQIPPDSDTTINMPAEVRSRSMVGRFPDVTLRWDEPEEEEETGSQQEGACKRWFRKICPCCCRKASDEHDGTDAVVTRTDDGGEKPPTAGHELDDDSVYMDNEMRGTSLF